MLSKSAKTTHHCWSLLVSGLAPWSSHGPWEEGYYLNCLECVCAQSCQNLCNPVNCSPPGFSVHGVLQARILEQDWTHISCASGIGRQILYHWATWEAPNCLESYHKSLQKNRLTLDQAFMGLQGMLILFVNVTTNVSLNERIDRTPVSALKPD